MWIDDGSQIYPGEKPQKSQDRKLKQPPIRLIEPNFTMATVIKIGPVEDMELSRNDSTSLK